MTSAPDFADRVVLAVIVLGNGDRLSAIRALRRADALAVSPPIPDLETSPGG